MKKPKTYNLSKEVYEAINKLAIDDGRKDSDWLNRYLSGSLLTKEISKPKPVKNNLTLIDMPEELNPYAWAEWIAFRKKAKFKKYKSDAPMKKLAKMGNYDEQM